MILETVALEQIQTTLSARGKFADRERNQAVRINRSRPHTQPTLLTVRNFLSAEQSTRELNLLNPLARRSNGREEQIHADDI